MNKKIVALIAGIVVILIGSFGIYKITQKNNEIINSNFVIGERKAIFTEKDYPKVDGSTETLMLSKAFKAEFLGKKLDGIDMTHNTTYYAYENLVNGACDLILVTYPSKEELDLAKAHNIELEIIPVANEALVFYNNNQNETKDISLEQLQKIYTGEITNWKEVSGEDMPIRVVQREKNSSVQTGLINLVMKDKDIMQISEEDTITSEKAMVNLVSDEESGKESIGYSYYYMIDNSNSKDKINLLSIDGINPNDETIKNGTYPLSTKYYIVINKANPKESNVRKLIKEMLGERGQKALEAVNYISM